MFHLEPTPLSLNKKKRDIYLNKLIFLFNDCRFDISVVDQKKSFGWNHPGLMKYSYHNERRFDTKSCTHFQVLGKSIYYTYWSNSSNQIINFFFIKMLKFEIQECSKERFFTKPDPPGNTFIIICIFTFSNAKRRLSCLPKKNLVFLILCRFLHVFIRGYH